MGAIWLTNAADVLRSAGLTVVEHDGWETRSRSSGGYDAIMGIGVHHDAVPTGVPLENRVAYEMHNASTNPIGAFHLHSDGVWHVLAAGATNTQGQGGPYTTSKGTIPTDAGNRYLVSIEASNNGVGEPWPTVLQDSYVRGCRALCDWLDLDPLRDIIAHFEWTSRKIDPAGPSRYATGSDMWDMALFRSDVATYAPEVPEAPDDADVPDDVAILAASFSEDDPMFITRTESGTFYIGNGVAYRQVTASNAELDYLIKKFRGKLTDYRFGTPVNSRDDVGPVNPESVTYLGVRVGRRAEQDQV